MIGDQKMPQESICPKTRRGSENIKIANGNMRMRVLVVAKGSLHAQGMLKRICLGIVSRPPKKRSGFTSWTKKKDETWF